ncbi:hypothetical protein NFI96_017640 [Prochilodus magdalenae]|nr:hypothetical protein NFI96_017640 [Prochilodus magdalenae]
MSLAKLPGIKGLVSTSQSRRRIKTELSAEMISLPLGDFRHTMHVGRGGDVFGDTSFLSEHGGRGSAPESPDSKTVRFFSRTLRHLTPPCAMSGGPPSLGSGQTPESSHLHPLPSHPSLKTPSHCPSSTWSMEAWRGHCSPLPPAAWNNHSTPTCVYVCVLCVCLVCMCVCYFTCREHICNAVTSVQSGFVTLPRLSRIVRNSTESPPPPAQQRRGSDPDPFPALQRSDSLTSFTVDLGPSLMSELLGLIHSSSDLQGLQQDLEDEEEEEEPSSLFEMAVESPCVSSRGHSSSPDWTQQETETGENGDDTKRVTPDASLWSPVRVEPTMEAERFQQAADVLARHYGGSGVRTGRQRAPYAFPEEEEEVKV